MIKTIFIGGGTPTILPPSYISKILDTVFQYSVDPAAEITVEANPGTLTAKSCAELKKSGVNRVSVGLQAWQDKLLRKLGRIHTQSDFLRSYENLIKAGFKNINVDLMFSLPGQTLADWRETLEKTTELNPSHISVYSLIIEEGTVFGKLMKEGQLEEAGEELDRAFYEEAKSFLTQRNYTHYEISNFSKPGRECLHNLGYWRRKNYIGLGISSHSFFEGIRFQNTDSLDSYIQAQGNIATIRKNFDIIGKKEAQEEFMFLGLRTLEGVCGKEFYDHFNSDLLSVYGKQLHRLIAQGLLFREGSRFFLTSKGIDVSNYVFGGFLQ